MEKERLIYTIREVKDILHTSPNYVYELINKGLLSAMKLGSYKVSKESLNKFIKESEGMDLSNLDNVVQLKKYE